MKPRQIFIALMVLSSTAMAEDIKIKGTFSQQLSLPKLSVKAGTKPLKNDVDAFGLKLKGAEAQTLKSDAKTKLRVAREMQTEVKALDEKYMHIC